jgi:hypothetical protein
LLSELEAHADVQDPRGEAAPRRDRGITAH